MRDGGAGDVPVSGKRDLRISAAAFVPGEEVAPGELGVAALQRDCL